MSVTPPQPTIRDTHNYALLLMERREYAKALEILLLLTTKLADEAQLWINCGQCYEALGLWDESHTAFELCLNAHKLRKQPGLARAHFGLGCNLFRLGCDEFGKSAWRRGLKCGDDSPESQFAMSTVLLTFGGYERGWKLYESRREVPGWKAGVKSHGVDLDNLPPEWDGGSPGHVLVYGEQGAGDILMFTRYLWATCEGSGYYHPRIQFGHDLKPLHEVYWNNASDCEWSAPIGSLPFLLRLEGPRPPNSVISPWEPLDNPKPRVGVCWKGSSSHMNDHDRSSPIDFRDAFQDERWDIVSLQVGYDFSPKDYLETAELMRTLDAVVTVDTSVVHLAGTLGVPTVLIPPASPEWRWGFGDTTPWYPSISIVRRKKVDAWPDAIRRAKQQLVGMI